MNGKEKSRSYLCACVACVLLLQCPVPLLSGAHSSLQFHTQNVLLRVPWDLQLNSIHLLPLEDGGGEASLYLIQPRCMCIC